MRAVVIAFGALIAGCEAEADHGRNMSVDAREAALERAMDVPVDRVALEPLTRSDGEAIALASAGCDFLRPSDGAVLMQAGERAAWTRIDGELRRFVADAGAPLLEGPGVAAKYDGLARSIRLEASDRPVEEGIGDPRYEANLTLRGASNRDVDRVSGTLRCAAGGAR